MIRFVLIESFKNIFRSKMTGIVTIFSMTTALTLISVIAILIYNMQLKLNEIKSQTTVFVFFKTSLSTEESQNAANRMKSISGVKGIKFISKTEGLKEYFKEAEKNNQSDIINTLDYNPLPDMVELYINYPSIDANYLNALTNQIKRIRREVDISLKTEEILKLGRYITLFIKVAGVIALFILIVTLILIFNTIRLSIHSKKLIIQTMRLVGAGPMIIKSPFILEGIYQALISCTFVALLTFYGLRYFNTKLDFIKDVLQAPLLFHPLHFIALFIFATIIAFFASAISVQKYLSFKFKK